MATVVPLSAGEKLEFYTTHGGQEDRPHNGLYQLPIAGKRAMSLQPAAMNRQRHAADRNWTAE
jgi:hypothetical protein